MEAQPTINAFPTSSLRRSRQLFLLAQLSQYNICFHLHCKQSWRNHFFRELILHETQSKYQHKRVEEDRMLVVVRAGSFPFMCFIGNLLWPQLTSPPPTEEAVLGLTFWALILFKRLEYEHLSLKYWPPPPTHTLVWCLQTVWPQTWWQALWTSQRKLGN